MCVWCLRGIFLLVCVVYLWTSSSVESGSVQSSHINFQKKKQKKHFLKKKKALFEEKRALFVGFLSYILV